MPARHVHTRLEISQLLRAFWLDVIAWRTEKAVGFWGTLLRISYALGNHLIL
jgi:hypothetical protein